MLVYVVLALKAVPCPFEKYTEALSKEMALPSVARSTRDVTWMIHGRLL